MSKRKLPIVIIILGLFWQCQQDKDLSFSIRQDGVGLVNRDTPFADIESLYEADSVVVDSVYSLSSNQRVRIFEKGGKHLLSITSNSDSIPGIGNIRIHDRRYVTDNGIGLASTFKDIKEQYEIKKVVTSLSNVVVFVKNHDLYFTIDREELPASLRYTRDVNIEAVQIPDKAALKYLMIAWE
ncbi:hypothetical protein [Lentiprolixibacter aurantiacus]|uniref:Uncharacterized protein n=1 Tax=Lentiprolixibacter aurantiacus TaxID=2993939 RepID=A0AAE3MNE2_9FLAO|nr:hypothetical protein [Lentiprolixibacter aurantiacus]MCX2720633.1 hypothetical protein [Lentiprolixibacter aurantiacus]